MELMFNRETTARIYDILFTQSDVVELRVFKPDGKPFSQYFPGDKEAFLNAAEQENSRGNTTYWCTNPVKQERFERWKKERRGATKNSDITCRRVLLIDIDAERGEKSNATDEERKAALAVAMRIAEELDKLSKGCYVVIDSGNGYHIYVFLNELENSRETTNYLKAFSQHFIDMVKADDSLSAKVDKGMHTPSHVAKIPGSIGYKGEPTAERPHRVSRIKYLPNVFTVLTLDHIKLITGDIDSYPESEHISGEIAEEDIVDIQQLFETYNWPFYVEAVEMFGGDCLKVRCPALDRVNGRTPQGKTDEEIDNPNKWGAYIAHRADGHRIYGTTLGEPTCTTYRQACELEPTLRPNIVDVYGFNGAHHKNGTARSTVPDSLKPASEYRPFPTHLLPQVLRQFVIDTAASYQCDEGLIAVPALGVICHGALETRPPLGASNKATLLVLFLLGFFCLSFGR